MFSLAAVLRTQVELGVRCDRRCQVSSATFALTTSLDLLDRGIGRLLNDPVVNRVPRSRSVCAPAAGCL